MKLSKLKADQAHQALRAPWANKKSLTSPISLMSFLLTFLLITLNHPICHAKPQQLQLLPEDIPLIDSFQNQYPEEENKKINVYKEKSPLALNQNEIDILGNISDLYNSELVGEIREQVTNFGFNKFSFGTGVVDVTFQVKDGVKFALKDTFAGYLEYERRKITEEFLNANLQSHKLTENFISGNSSSSNPINIISSIFGIDLNNIISFEFSNLIILCKEILNKTICKNIFTFFQYVAFTFLAIFTTMRLIKNLRFQANDSLSRTIIDAFNCFLLIQFMPDIINLLFELISLIQAIVLSMIEFHLIDLQADYTSLERSWENVANSFGYMPAVLLSIIDAASQIFVYFFLLGLIIFIVIGKILSPLWPLALISLSLRTSFIDNLLSWCKNILALALIPLIFLIVNLLAHELRGINNGIFEVISSIAGFTFLPFSLNILKTKSTNLLEPAFMGYSQSLDSIKDSLNSLNYSLQNLDKNV